MTSLDTFVGHRPLGLHTANLPMSPVPPPAHPAAPSAVPFITVSCQIGVNCQTVPRRVADVLNASLPDRQHWSVWERELIEKTAVDYHIPVEDIEYIEQAGTSWLESFIEGLGDVPDDVAIFHRLRHEVQSLAKQGRAILVGHGSVFMSKSLPGGVHIRLIAPWQQRVESFARATNSSIDRAAKQLIRLERRRRAFIRRFWPGETVDPVAFSATFNAAALDDDRLVSAIAALVPHSTAEAIRHTGQALY